MINKTIKRGVFIIFFILVILLFSNNSVHAVVEEPRYLFDAEAMSDGRIAVLFSKGGTSSNNNVRGGRLYLGFYNPLDNYWEEIPVGNYRIPPEGYEAALDLFEDKAHIVYRDSYSSLSYIYQTDDGWSDKTYIYSMNANSSFDVANDLLKPDIAIDSNGKAHITYIDIDGAKDSIPKEFKEDAMYATNESGEFVKSCISDGTGWKDVEFSFETKLSEIKIDFDEDDRLIAYNAYSYSTGEYWSEHLNYTMFFNNANGTTSYDMDIDNSGKIFEVCKKGEHDYIFMTRNGNLLVSDGNNSIVEGTSISSPIVNADMTLDGTDIYYAGIDGSSLLLYQKGTFVKGKTIPTSISNHTIITTVVSNGVQYVLYTGEGDDKPLVIVKLNNGEVEEYKAHKEVRSWSELQDALKEDGNIKLGRDIIATEEDTHLYISTHVNLDLNGYVINRNLDNPTANGEVFFVDRNGYLNIEDSRPDATHTPNITYKNLKTNEDVAVNGGIITGGYSNGGSGGIYFNGANGYLGGGTIVGNKVVGNDVYGNAGGVLIRSAGVTVSGTSICGNEAFYGNGNKAVGGIGIFDYQNIDTTLDIYDGMITGNFTNSIEDGCYGGVFNWNGEIRLHRDIRIFENMKNSQNSNVVLSNTSKGKVINIMPYFSGVNIGITSCRAIDDDAQVITKGYDKSLYGENLTQYFTSDDENGFFSFDSNGEVTISKGYNITVSYEGNGTAWASTTRGASGTKIDLSCSVEDPFLYRLKEWQVISGNVNIENNSFTIGTSDVEIKAIFEEIPKYTLTFEANGGMGNMVNVTQNDGTVFELPKCDYTAPEGYRFKDWIVIPEDGSGEQYYNLGTEITFDQNYTIKPRWTPIEYTITYILNGGVFQNQTPPSTYTIESGDITIDNLTRNDLVFAGWTGTGLSEPTLNLTIPSGSVGNRTYTAEWIVDYNLWIGSTRVNSGNARDVLKDGGTVMYDVTTNTLTLNNATIMGTGDSERGYGIKYLGNTNLSIVADGRNVISDPTTRTEATAGILLGGDIGVYSQNFTRSDYTANLNITVHEDSSLWIASGTALGGNYPSSYGICLWQDSGNVILSGKGDLRITLGISTYNYGINTPDSITINSTGEVYIPGGDSSSPRYYSEGIHGNNITINSGNVVVTPGVAEFASIALSTDGASSYGEEYGDIIINGGTVSAIGGIVNKNNGTGDYDKSKSYGIYSDKDIIINGEDLVVARTGATEADIAMALNKAPIINTGNIAGANIDDTQNEAVVYVPENNDTYKWFQTPYTKPEASVQKVRGLFVRYNDDYQELVEAENVKGGTIVYSLDGENFSEEIPKAKEKNRYTVYYKVIGDFNHNDSQVESVEAQIYYPAGLIKKDGKLVYVEFGEIATYKSTLAKYDVNGIWYYVQNGEVLPGANTLVKYEGLWFYVENSMINWNYTGLFKYGGRWFYIKNGEVQFGANTLYKYKGVWFYINKGEIDWNYTGLFKYSGVWFYIRNGEVDWNANTLVKYNGKWYYINRGEIDWNFTGIFYYEGLNFYIRKGELTWGFDGTITYNGKNYTIRNSTVV